MWSGRPWTLVLGEPGAVAVRPRRRDPGVAHGRWNHQHEPAEPLGPPGRRPQESRGTRRRTGPVDRTGAVHVVGHGEQVAGEARPRVVGGIGGSARGAVPALGVADDPAWPRRGGPVEHADRALDRRAEEDPVRVAQQRSIAELVVPQHGPGPEHPREPHAERHHARPRRRQPDPAGRTPSPRRHGRRTPGAGPALRHRSES